MFLCSGHIYFILWNKSEKNEKQNLLQNVTKYLSFEVSNFSITFFLKIISSEGGGGLGICHMFMDSIDFKQQICCSFLQMGWEGGEGWVKNLGIFCGLHKCMTPNVKKVTFLALVPMFTS